MAFVQAPLAGLTVTETPSARAETPPAARTGSASAARPTASHRTIPPPSPRRERHRYGSNAADQQKVPLAPTGNRQSAIENGQSAIENGRGGVVETGGL